jgi:hypothetical protein
VEDMISRSVGELRKNAFGDDAEDAKRLAWTREQAWTVLKQLSKEDEVCVVPIICYDNIHEATATDVIARDRFHITRHC